MQSRSLLEGKTTKLKHFLNSIIFNPKNANKNIAFLFVLSIALRVTNFKLKKNNKVLRLGFELFFNVQTRLKMIFTSLPYFLSFTVLKVLES